MTKVSEKTYVDLKSRIIAGEFATGTKMREVHLAKMLGVSRTPVRAALEKLIDDGLLKNVRSSVEVSSFQPWDLIEIFELRLLLEPHAAGLAAIHCDENDVAILDKLNDEMSECIEHGTENRIEHIQEINNKFHHAVLNAAKSARVIDMLSPYLDVPRITGSFYIYSEIDLRGSLNHHKQITNALRNKSQTMAQDSMRFHIMTSFMRFKDKQKIN